MAGSIRSGRGPDFSPLFRRSIRDTSWSKVSAPARLEGHWPHDKIVVMEFPDETEAGRFINSRAYQDISRDRMAGAETVSLLVRGLPQPPPQ